MKHLQIKILFLSLFAISTFYLLHRRLTAPSSSFSTATTTTTSPPRPTTLRHLFFSIASSVSSFPRREPYVNLWYSLNTTRALLFLDKIPPPSVRPPIPFVVSGDTSHFPYTFPRGHRAALRIARLVKEAVDRNPPDVRWFVFGDDDTVFFPSNLVKVLRKYDHEKWYYIGSSTESSEQSHNMGFNMAYGGGGFVFSAPLAKAVAKVLDSCLMRYPHVYGSDARVFACVTELGVELTREPGFHQLDVRGNLFGMLTAHPLSPLLSLHHLEIVEPIFPRMNQLEALKHLFKAYHVDPGRILQQTVCYERASNLTVSVSWGYAVQVYQGNRLLPDILAPERTFTPWRRRGINIPGQYVFNTRDSPKDHCNKSVVFFREEIGFGSRRVWSKYTLNSTSRCPSVKPIKKLKDIKVFTKKLSQDVGQVVVPRRFCCDIMQPIDESMVIDIRQCGFHELIAMNA